MLEVPANVREYGRVEVDHGELADRVRQVGMRSEQVNRHCDEIVVAQQDDSFSFETAGVMKGERAAEFRLDGAMRLVELGSGPRCVRRDTVERRDDPLELLRDAPAVLVAGGAAGVEHAARSCMAEKSAPLPG